MVKVLKAGGWALLALTAMSFLGALLVLATDQDTKAMAGFLMIASFFGVPGGLMLWRGTLIGREQKFREELGGYMRTHDRFTAKEMAAKIGKSEMETESLIARIANEQKVDLVFH